MNALLKKAMLANALFSAISGTLILVFAQKLQPHYGLDSHLPLQLVGAALLPFAFHLVMATRRKQVHIGEIYYLIACDCLWVLGSIFLPFTSLVQLSNLGASLFISVAALVALFACLQIYGTKQRHLI